MSISHEPHYVVDEHGTRIAVIVPIDVYERLLDAWEDREDARWVDDYEQRKAAGLLTPDELEAIPLEEVISKSEAERSHVE